MKMSVRRNVLAVLTVLGVILCMGLPAQAEFPIFEDNSGLPSGGGYGSLIVTGDVDGDNDIDIITSKSGPFEASVLFNDGNEVFTDSSSAIPALSNTREPAVAADFDGDGDLDLLFGTRAGIGGVSAAKDILLINDGTGNYSDQSSQLPNVNTLPVGRPTLIDVEGDGDIDIFIGNGRTSPTVSQQDNLFINNGMGTFTDGTSQLPTISDVSHGAAAGDIDGDGDTDIIVNTRFGRNKVLVNDGMGNFTDERDTQWPNISTQSHRDPFLIDVDNDGDLDFYEPTHGPTNPTAAQLNRLYLNNGSGIFTDVTATNLPNVLIQSGGFDAVGDIDGDGSVDIIASATDISSIRVFSFDSSGSATLKPNSEVFSPNVASGEGVQSSAIVDIDQDGDNDVFLAKVTPNSEIVFYRNGPASETIVINEIMWDQQEYIELRNLTSTSIEIGGWHITVGGDTEIVIDSSKTIPANGFYLIADANAVDSPVIPDEIDGMTLLQGGELVKLVNTDGEVVDTANRAGAWFAGVNDAAGQSMERNSISSDGTSAASWHTTTGTGGGRIGTPGAANSPDPFVAGPGEVVINEIMWDELEYIELHNISGNVVDIGSWEIHAGGSKEITIDNGAIIPVDGFYVIADNNAVDTPDEVDGMILLQSGELVELFDNVGTLIDDANQVGDWFAGANTAFGESMERISALVPGSDSTNWQTSTGNVGGRIGTPGEANPIPPVVPNPGEVVINEIMWDEKEYIELLNTSDTTIDLSNWVIVGDGFIEIVIDSGASIAPNAFYVIADDGTTLSGCTPDEEEAMTLNNVDGELLELLTPDSTVIDVANQTSGGWFAGVNDTEGISMERSDSTVAGTDSGNWETSTGSLCGRNGTAGSAN